MDEHFMKSYLSHVVQTCHKHGKGFKQLPLQFIRSVYATEKT